MEISNQGHRIYITALIKELFSEGKDMPQNPKPDPQDLRTEVRNILNTKYSTLFYYILFNKKIVKLDFSDYSLYTFVS